MKGVVDLLVSIRQLFSSLKQGETTQAKKGIVRRRDFDGRGLETALAGRLIVSNCLDGILAWRKLSLPVEKDFGLFGGIDFIGRSGDLVMLAQLADHLIRLIFEERHDGEITSVGVFVLVQVISELAARYLDQNWDEAWFLIRGKAIGGGSHSGIIFGLGISERCDGWRFIVENRYPPYVR